MDNPKPGTLILTSPSLLASQLFFDPKPWLTIGLAVILVSVVCWLPFIRGMTRSITQMTQAAERIAEGHFEVQVPSRRHDEIGQMGDAINRMAARLSGFVSGQKRFLGGIAHELCNPIATIQFALGSLERRVTDEQRDGVADIQEEVQHMSALVNELLSFSRAGMQGMDVKLVPVNLAGTLTRVLEREASPAVSIETAVDAQLEALADPEYLFRAISNVVRNAIRYAGHAGPIRVSATAAEGKVHITIADEGPGVPEDALDEIFAPFYRLDPARNQQTGGVGLGLAIVKACVESCSGTVRCRNRKPSGLEIEIELAEARREQL
jgi:two-component system sensor histidine kinase CpxA